MDDDLKSGSQSYLSNEYLADLSSKVRIASNENLLSFSSAKIKIDEDLKRPPRRSSHQIGWKVETTPPHEDVNRAGDKFGPYRLARPRCTAEKCLGWPLGSSR